MGGEGIEGLNVMEDPDDRREAPQVVDGGLDTAAIAREIRRTCGNLPSDVQAEEYAERVAQLSDHGDMEGLYHEDPRGD